MDSSPLLFTIQSSAPVKVEFDLEQGLLNNSSISSPFNCQALGISSISEMNPQRYTAMGRSEVEGLMQLHQKNGFLSKCSSDLWAVTFYPDEPIEAADIQPYSRPQRGSNCVFSMSGELPGIHDGERFPIGDQWPLSCNDQERAFCLLQERTRKLWKEGRPDHEMRLALMADHAGRLDKLGLHNFIHWDGEMLFAYSSLNEGLEPLVYKQISGRSIQLKGELPLTITAEENADTLIVASRSLLNEGEMISPGSVLCFANGIYVDRCDPVTFWNTQDYF
ncbi:MULTISPECIES: class II glutamine amidotransferase [unclassified Neptuniibacter]|uniref:class II glutamine amidotransferase n=1 Tax=unclassified Neptuniibacter TaxID=2630693 RepID=UPI000C5F65D3|nr:MULTISPECIES: class II glutamine amidotransferase [unclassified Neptuniibacter]MAY41178.1 hypothetical protein [Oceanospirillaceae bacterium]|tara:strand:+ start:23717 stop:24550 length:834 start_codon:yes stop_codon:yes gene_type:complete